MPGAKGVGGTKRVRWGSVTKPTAAASDRVTAGATLPWEEAAGRRPVAGDQHKYRTRPLNDLSCHPQTSVFMRRRSAFSERLCCYALLPFGKSPHLLLSISLSATTTLLLLFDVKTSVSIRLRDSATRRNRWCPRQTKEKEPSSPLLLTYSAKLSPPPKLLPLHP